MAREKGEQRRGAWCAKGGDWREVHYARKDRILYDVAKVFAIVKLNSFFVIPGPRSLSEGHFNPSEVLQISNLIAVKPLVMMLANEVVDEEKDVWKLTASFKGI